MFRGQIWTRNLKDCNSCQMMQKSPPLTPMHPWEWSQRPWSCLHIDYAGPFLGKMFFVTVDAHSKWIEADIIDNALYHPASNGLAKRAVQTLKIGLKITSGALEDRLAWFLFQYHLTPHSTTGTSQLSLAPS